MKKFSKVCYKVLCIAAALLFIWSIADLYRYLVFGRDYSYRKQIAAGILIIICFHKSKKAPAVRSARAICLLLIFTIIGTWLVSMVNFTIVRAQDIYDELYRASYSFPEKVDVSGTYSTFYDEYFDGQNINYETLENNMVKAITHNSDFTVRNFGYYDIHPEKNREKLIRERDYPLETAVLYYDSNGSLLHSNDNDFLFFNYYTQEEWDSGMYKSSGTHDGWLDMSEGKNAEKPEDDPYHIYRSTYAASKHLNDIKVIRVTGYFEGTKLKPIVMHYISHTQLYDTYTNSDMFSSGSLSSSYIVSELDKAGKLQWQLNFDNSSEPCSEELVTVYLDNPEMWSNESKEAVYNGEKYESLAALTKALDFPSWADLYLFSENLQSAGKFELNNLLIFGGWTYRNWEGIDYLSGEKPEPEYILVTVVKSNPLACAMAELRNLYIVTGLLTLALFIAAYTNIKMRLLKPVAAIANAMENGWKNIPEEKGNAPKPWYEAEKLLKCYTKEQDLRRKQNNEITRLNTALDYAKTAEQRRRQMTSNIAHELKTPLAIIHSYTEGLKEHIAEDKRDKYLEVILAETARTDALVLQMLDLSRLEAGKVKLSRDEFSLGELTKGIFEKLQMAADTTKLQIRYEFPENCSIVADENRITQVVENFATNAVKYTPVGGNVTVRIKTANEKTYFSIENESSPLPPEALSKVWDTFYRVDQSRTGGGTGLGLAIAKNIVELHGGKCTVRNTKIGVEFGFSI